MSSLYVGECSEKILPLRLSRCEPAFNTVDELVVHSNVIQFFGGFEALKKNEKSRSQVFFYGYDLRAFYLL